MPMLSDDRQENRDAISLEAAVSVLEGKWKLIILFQLLQGKARYGELRRRVPSVTQRTLTNHLRELEFQGLIERHVYAEVPVKVEYAISSVGRTLEPVLDALKCWGETRTIVPKSTHTVLQ